MPAPPTVLPERIGTYRIVGLVGEGGMGAVYEAQQESPRRTVALKVIRPGHVTPQMLRRFEHECEVLGRLQHPGIAQIHEAGTVLDGHGRRLPFFAMEFIRGEELDLYARHHSLGTRERLELMARVCDAVSHAHQKGVIHRDLKPGNILVDETGQPKILDFGVARATDADVQRTTLQTDVGAIIGTIPYMSPEQVGGDPHQLDTRSDVYALGVITYELLTGRMPYDLSARMVHEALRVIREEEPTRLSRIDRHLRGDVETIVGKALEKDKTRRYPSAESFAADIRRHLAFEPISARPASTWYQAAKFARRNKGLVTGLAVALLLLIVGLIGTGLGLREALAAGEREIAARKAAQASEAAAIAAGREEQRQREQAERERRQAEIDRDKSRVIAEFLAGTLGGLEQMTALDRDTTLLEEMLDRAARRLENGDLRATPEAELYLLDSIGPLYLQISKPESARRLLERAVARHRTQGEDSIAMALSLSQLGSSLDLLGKSAEGVALLDEAVQMWERTGPADDRDFALTLSHLGQALMSAGDFRRSEQVQRRAVEMWRRLDGEASIPLSGGLRCLGAVQLRQGDLAGAETTLREALTMVQGLVDDDHPIVATSSGLLGQVLEMKGDLAGAADLLRAALASQRRLHRSDHELVAGAMSSLSGVLVGLREFDEAEALARESLAMYRRLFPGDHPRVALQTNNVGHLLQQKGDLDGAEALFREALAMLQRILPASHPSLPPLLHNLGCLLVAKSDFEAAVPLFRDAIERMDRLFPDGHPHTALCRFQLAEALRGQGDLAAAEAMHREALAMRRACFPGGHFSIEQSLHALGRVVQERGDHDGGAVLIEEARAMRSELGLKPR
ncbi:MAG: serine/threonine protein kinase [Planctomycetes bacterium]|nr:serine/threonine protein kinase [Planctomycetota bacterium]